MEEDGAGKVGLANLALPLQLWAGLRQSSLWVLEDTGQSIYRSTPTEPGSLMGKGKEGERPASLLRPVFGADGLLWWAGSYQTCVC